MAMGEKHAVELAKVIGEYSFRLDELPETKIKIRLFRYLDNPENVYFSTSHYIHTPTQFDAYRTSRNWEYSEEQALKRAIETITSYYQNAIDTGETPEYSWLVPNTMF